MIQIAYRPSHQLANNKQQGACRSPNNCLLDMDDLDMSHVICDIADPMGPWKAKSHFLCTTSSQVKVLPYDNGNPPRFNAPWYGKTGVSRHGQAEATAMATMMSRYAITKGRMFKGMRDSECVESSTIHEGPRIHKQAERDIQVPCFMTGKRRNDYESRLVMTLNVELCNHSRRWTDAGILRSHCRMYHKSVEL